jgi:malate permease and related proteins
VLLVLLAISACTAVGIVAERRAGARAEAFAQRLIAFTLWVVLPPVVFLVTAGLELDRGVVGGLGLAYLELAVVGVLAFVLCRRVLHLTAPQTGSIVCASILANTGYLGIPLTAALLGTDALAPAVAWDSVVSGVMLFGPAFAIGAALGTKAGTTPRERAIAFLTRNPVLPAVLAGFLAPDALAPDALVEIAEIAALSTLPVGFFVLGVNLRLPQPLSRPVAVVMGLRVVVAPALMAGLALALAVDVPDAYLVQAAMPSGINTLIVAHTFGLDVRLAAASIAWTTVTVVLVAVGVSFVV